MISSRPISRQLEQLSPLEEQLRLKLRNGLQRIHICIFYQNINKNFLIKMLYVL